MATPDPFADIPVTGQPQAPADPFADIPVMSDPFADIPVTVDRRPPASIADQFAKAKTKEQRMAVLGTVSSWAERRNILEQMSPEDQMEWFQSDRAQSDFLAGTVRGLGRTIASVLKAPGVAVEAARTADTGKPAELVWDDPTLLPGSLLMAGKAGIEKLENLFYEPPTRTLNWYEQIPEATGSALAFIGAGAAGGLPTVALAGMGATGVEQYEDAVAKGADPDEALLSFAAGSLLGTTEAVPMAFFLNRINRLAGGRLAQLIREQGLDKVSRSALADTIKGFLAEFAQEGGQAVGSNWIARDIAGYDPARSLGENFWDNALTGGAVGALLGGGLGYVNKLQERDALEQLERAFNELRNEPINQLVGPMSYLFGRPELMQMKANIDAQMLAEGAEALKERTARLEKQPGKPIVPELIHQQDLQKPVYEGVSSQRTDTWWTAFGSKPVETTIETGLPKSSLGTTLTVAEAVEKQPVVVAKTGLYEGEIARIGTDIQQMEHQLKTIQTSPEMREAWELDLKNSREAKIVLLAKQKIEHQLLRHAKDIIAAYRNLTPNTRYVIVDNFGLKPESSDADGQIEVVRGVKLRDGTTTNVATVYLSLERLVDRSYVDRKSIEGSQPYARLKRRLFETISHEIGHSVMVDFLNDVYEKALGDPDLQIRQQNRQLFALIEQDYVRWLQDVAKNKQDFIMMSSFALERGFAWDRMLDDPGLRAATDRMTAGGNPFLDSGQSLKDYALSFDEYFAEQTSRLATQGRLDNELLTKFFRPVLQQYKDAFEEFPEYAKNEYGKNWLKFLESRTLDWKIREAQDKALATAKDGRGIFDALAGKLEGFDPKKFRGLREHLDTLGPYLKGLGYGFNLLQMVEVNPHIQNLQLYRNAVLAWQNFQRAMGVGTIEGLLAWKKLAKAEASQLSNVFVEEGDLRRRFTPDELAKRLTAEGFKVYTMIRQQLDNVLEEMRAVALADANKTFEQGTEIQKAEIEKVNTEFDRMKERGYFPSIRFGKFTITARATKDMTWQGENFKQGQLITFPVFETEKERDSALETLRTELAGIAAVSPSIMREDEFAIQGMPRAMLRALKNRLAQQGELTPSLEAAFDQALAQVAPFRNFRKQWLRKKGIHGASDDLMRSYAYYMRSAAGHIARVRFGEEMLASITSLQDDVEIIKRSGGPAQNRQEMVHWLRRHFDYIMNPAEEMAALRGVGFVAYLGFNIKSAFINATQLVMTTYPYLAGRYGDAAAVAALGKATVQLQDWVRNKKKYVADVKLSQAHYYQQRAAYAIRSGPVVGGGAHFAVDNGLGDDIFESLAEAVEGGETSELGFYDLRGLNIATTDVDMEAIINKTRELELAGDRGDLQGGQGPLYSVAPIASREEVLELLDEMSGSNFISSKEAEQAGLYRGARALGFDGFFVYDADEAFSMEGTVSVFGNLHKIKSITEKEFRRRQEIARSGIAAEKERLMKLIARGMHEGWLDQSLATELAIAASENNVDRGLHLPSGKRFWHEVSRYSALPFHLVEKMNRYLTAIAAYELEYAKNKDHEKAVLTARHAVWTTQYENSRWNRPEVLRGKKSTVFLFMNFVQNSLFFAVKDKGARRYWMMMLIMAGVMGLPGAEDLEDVVDFTATGLNMMLGIKNPKVQLRRELREALEELGANPDLILHGISQDSFGLGHVGELTGIPIPHFDLSGSIGMGNVVPGTKLPSALMQKTPADAFLEAVGELGGAGGNLVEGFYRGIFSSELDDWKRMEKLLPLISARNVSKAIRLATRGQESTAAGEVVAEFDATDPREFLTLVGQGLGFQPSKLTLGWERTIAARDLMQYYQVQQTALQGDINWAYFQEDREAVADARKAIAEYNSIVPYPELKMRPDNIRQGIKRYVELQLIREAGYAGQRKNERLLKGVQEAYPDPYADTFRKDPGALP